MVHPCCGYSLQKATKILSIVEMVISSFILFVNMIALAEYIPLAVEERDEAAVNPIEDKTRINAMITVLLAMNTTFWLVSLLLGIHLFVAAKQRDLRKCRTWFVVTCILTILYIVEIMMEAFSMRSNAAQIASPVVGSFLQTYMLWVVSSYMNELRHGGCIPIKSADGDIAA